MENNNTNWYVYECDQPHHSAASAPIPPYPTDVQRKTIEVNGEEVYLIHIIYLARIQRTL